MFGLDSAGFVDGIASEFSVASGLGVATGFGIESDVVESVAVDGTADVERALDTVASGIELVVCVFADADGSIEGELPAASSVLDTLSTDGGFIVGWGKDADDSLFDGLLAAEPLLDTVSADGGFIVGCGTGRESTVDSFVFPVES